MCGTVNTHNGTAAYIGAVDNIMRIFTDSDITLAQSLSRDRAEADDVATAIAVCYIYCVGGWVDFHCARFDCSGCSHRLAQHTSYEYYKIRISEATSLRHAIQHDTVYIM